MLRKVLIAFCLLTSLATLALWADSFRPRYKLADLEAEFRAVEESAVVASPELTPAAARLAAARSENCRHGWRGYSIGNHELEAGLTHRMVPCGTQSPNPALTSWRCIVAPSLFQISETPGILTVRYFWNGGDIGEWAMPRQRIYSLGGLHVLWVHGGQQHAAASCVISFPLGYLSVPSLLLALVLGWKSMHQWRRRRRGLCVKCAYDLRGTTSARCPECGTEITGRPQRAEP